MIKTQVLFVALFLLAIMNNGKAKDMNDIEITPKYIKEANKGLQQMSGVKIDNIITINSVYIIHSRNELVINFYSNIDALSDQYTVSSLKGVIDIDNACKKYVGFYDFSNIDEISVFLAYRFNNNKVIDFKVKCRMKNQPTIAKTSKDANTQLKLDIIKQYFPKALSKAESLEVAKNMETMSLIDFKYAYGHNSSVGTTYLAYQNHLGNVRYEQEMIIEQKEHQQEMIIKGLMIASSAIIGIIILVSLFKRRKKIKNKTIGTVTRGAKGAMSFKNNAKFNKDMEYAEYYKQAGIEFDNNVGDEALFAVALVKADGDKNKHKVEYMKLRVHRLKQG
jgi:hypothetical protein